MADAESSRKKMVFIGGIPHAACCRRDLLCRAACCHRLDGQVVEDGGCKAFMGRSRAIRVPNFEASDLLLSEKRGQGGRPPGRQSGNPRGRPVRSCNNIAEIAGLTDESVCPTLVRQTVRFCGAGAFACQPILLRLLTPWVRCSCRVPPARAFRRCGVCARPPTPCKSRSAWRAAC